jgi:trigger factor
VVVFAWSALVVFTAATAGLLVLLSRALFGSIDRVDRVRDEVWSMAKTLETIAVRMERIEAGLGQGDQRLDELRADLRRRLEEAAQGQMASELETRVLQAYLDQVDVPLPESMVHDELHYRANRFAQQLGMMGATLDQYLEAIGQTSDDVEADLRAQSVRAVGAQLVLEAVAEAENMEVTEEEVEAEIQRQAQRVGRDPEEVRSALAEGRAGVISGDILRSKALAFMVEHAEQRDPAPDDASEPKE